MTFKKYKIKMMVYNINVILIIRKINISIAY